MKRLIKTFSIPESYISQTKVYNYKDFILSLILYFSYSALMLVSGFVLKSNPKINNCLFGTIYNLSFTFIIIFVLKLRGINIESLGIKKGNLKLSLLFGITLSVILFFLNCISNVFFDNQSFIPLKNILINTLYYLTVALCEEVLFRGFILTRLHGLTKNILFDVIISGIMFVFMHYPFRMIYYNLSFLSFITNYGYILDLFITHLILSFIRIKSDCLYGSILPHWISDLSYSIVTHL